MNQSNIGKEQRDPLGLSQLPPLDPPNDGWNAIRSTLEADRSLRNRKRLGVGLGMAACLALVIGLGPFQPPNEDTGQGADITLADNNPAELNADSAQDSVNDLPPAMNEAQAVTDLIAMSQVLEQRLRLLRDETSAMPSEAIMVVAELEDLVARVDGQLSMDPGSLNLWTQRVNLMMDLEVLFQHQFEREYGRMASL